ncbi:tetratricopeptide repeat protein [Luteimonas cucumeris]|uniref:Tetratricopeptide repeat protein n=1 Tax=Luteimonas cucumeris TaxID=985012 RepID=A0A562LE56_9GAMM|nr:tetratricopeptide repeat protein [Luteimonas cucumeris]TWI05923.1 tetratricopeptide repeat protein [Luteimonas cucumeris]
MIRALLIAVSLMLSLATCKAPESRESASTPAPALFEDFGDLHRDIGSKVPAAQRYFDQGLRLAYGFNHEAAGRAFAEAARLDPDCAICLWGQALVLGPNINMPMPADAVVPAARLSAEALLLADAARPADRALIEALAKRYSESPPTDRKPLDEAYAEAMADVARRFPDDDDVAALYAEALMDLSPWAYWDKGGKPVGRTREIVATLEGVLKRNPRHLGAIHYYIHAVEASRTPQRAEPYADALAGLAPGSGHLVHMPAHIYIRTGRYHDATLTNFAASTADAAFLAVCGGSNGIYPLGYVPHNWHFATMSAGLHGSRELALNAAQQTAQRADPKQLESLTFMQQYLVMPLLTQVRFGQWPQILAQTAPPADLPYPRAIWHFSRGMAFVRGGEKQKAQVELEALQGIAADPAMKDVVVGAINHAGQVLAVAVPMLQGELALAKGQRKTGIARLRDAAKAEDALAYNEPSDWPLPVRHYLGAALLDAGQPREAARIYAQDLSTYPKNGWSLYGLAKAQRKLGNPKTARQTERRYQDAWQWSDTPLTASRL